jgi:hypothetical protein
MEREKEDVKARSNRNRPCGKKTWPNQEKVGGALKAQVPAKATAPNQIMALLMAQTGERYVKRLASDILQRGPYILKDFSWK